MTEFMKRGANMVPRPEMARWVEKIPAAVRYDPASAAALVQDSLISKLPGDPWKGPGR